MGSMVPMTLLPQQPQKSDTCLEDSDKEPRLCQEIPHQCTGETPVVRRQPCSLVCIQKTPTTLVSLILPNKQLTKLMVRHGEISRTICNHQVLQVTLQDLPHCRRDQHILLLE